MSALDARDELARMRAAATAVYETPLNEQPAEAHLNTILWRLGVAAGLLRKGQGFADVDPDELLAELERRLSAEAAEPEWEYTTAGRDGGPSESRLRSWGSVEPRHAKFRRTKAGPWLPIETAALHEVEFTVPEVIAAKMRQTDVGGLSIDGEATA